MKKERILFVDDEESIIQLAKALFSAEKYTLDTALDGREALRKLSENKYDLVVADLNLGSVSGIDIYEYIKRNLPGLENKILFTTGDEISQENVSFFRKISANIISKPFDIDIFRKVVSNLLES